MQNQSDPPDSDDEFKALPPDYYEKQAMIKAMEAERRSRARNLPELKADIMLLVSARYAGAPPAAVRLNELNRRFGVVANRMGSSCRDLVIELLNENQLSAFKLRDSTLVLDKAAHRMAMEPFMDDPVARDAMEQAILKRAFPEKDEPPKRQAVAKKSSFWG